MFSTRGQGETFSGLTSLFFLFKCRLRVQRPDQLGNEDLGQAKIVIHCFRQVKLTCTLQWDVNIPAVPVELVRIH